MDETKPSLYPHLSDRSVEQRVRRRLATRGLRLMGMAHDPQYGPWCVVDGATNSIVERNVHLRDYLAELDRQYVEDEIHGQ